MKTLSIFGYGSLMTYSSVLKTMPSASNHRSASTLAGFERIFNLVSISGIRNGQANHDTRELAALAMRRSKEEDGALPEVRGVVFEIPESEFDDYCEREHRYNVKKIDVEDAFCNTVSCWTVLERTDENYRASMSEIEYHERVGQYYDSGPLWGDTSVLPLRQYLINCIEAAAELDKELELYSLPTLSNLLDGATLADGVTSIREYVQNNTDRFPESVVTLAISTPYYKEVPSSRL